MEEYEIEDHVAAFVEAADRLVNLLATDPGSRPSARRAHGLATDLAYDRYDAARAALMGDPAEEDDTEAS